MILCRPMTKAMANNDFQITEYELEGEDNFPEPPADDARCIRLPLITKQDTGTRYQTRKNFEDAFLNGDAKFNVSGRCI